MQHLTHSENSSSKLAHFEGGGLVSVIINCFNCSRYVDEAISSILAQDYELFELILWDNASTDQCLSNRTFDDQRIRYFRNENTVSLGEARNQALTYATGKYIAFLDSDDISMPYRLSVQVALLEETGAAICHGGASIINSKGGIVGKHIPVAGYYQNGRHLLKKYDINMQTVMVRADIIKNNKIRFDPALLYAPDYDFFMHIALSSSIVATIDVFSMYRIHPDSLSSRSATIIGKEMRYINTKLNNEYFLEDRYPYEYKYSRSMLAFYDALSLLANDDRASAIRAFRSAAKLKIKYRLFYFFMHFPLPASFFLRFFIR